MALLIRLPLILLPGIGRDEALYYYWAFHPEPAYAPLMQFLVHLFGSAPLPAVLAARCTSILAGIAVIYLLDQLLSASGTPSRWRMGIVAALAFSPWQTYTGAILHPDNLLLAAILGYAGLMLRGRYAMAGLAAGLAVWVKPSGLLLVAVAIFNFLYLPGVERRAARTGVVLALLIPLPVVAAMNVHLVNAMAEFGKMETGALLWQGVLLQSAALALLGGPGLIFAAWRGLGHYVRGFGRGWFFAFAPPERDYAHLSLSIAFLFLAAFGGAAVCFGQVKANWMLPAFVMLAGGGWHGTRWRHLVRAGAASAFLGIAMTLTLSVPAILQTIEANFPGLGKSYVLQAGRRESHVSATAAWSDRVREYQNMDAFVRDIQTVWRNHAGSAAPRWIVCDDYGLAAQLAFAWQRKNMRLLIVEDELFRHRLPDEATQHLQGGVLIMAVHTRFPEIFPRLQHRRLWLHVPHPYAARSVAVGTASGTLE